MLSRIYRCISKNLNTVKKLFFLVTSQKVKLSYILDSLHVTQNISKVILF